jgi:hypothetical protein
MTADVLLTNVEWANGDRVGREPLSGRPYARCTGADSPDCGVRREPRGSGLTWDHFRRLSLCLLGDLLGTQHATPGPRTTK